MSSTSQSPSVTRSCKVSFVQSHARKTKKKTGTFKCMTRSRPVWGETPKGKTRTRCKNQEKIPSPRSHSRGDDSSGGLKGDSDPRDVPVYRKGTTPGRNRQTANESPGSREQSLRAFQGRLLVTTEPTDGTLTTTTGVLSLRGITRVSRSPGPTPTSSVGGTGIRRAGVSVSGS